MKVIDTLVGMCFRNTVTPGEYCIRFIVLEVDGHEAFVIEIDDFNEIKDANYDVTDLCNDYYIITKEEFLEAYDKAISKQRDDINKIIK